MTKPPESTPELMWHNKDKPLVTHSNEEPTSEAPGLHTVGTFGTDPRDNVLIFGDARYALDALVGSTDFAETYVGRVKLAYIDPPFNTGNNFSNYRDRVEHSVWLTVFRDTVIQVKSILSEDGSIWVHLDNSEQHRARVVLDEVFGAENFVSTVIWERTRTPRAAANALSVSHDYIHVYRKSRLFTLQSLPNDNDAPPRRAHTIWSLDDVGSGREGSAESRRLFDEPFATPKPERLLARVLQLTTEPGDIVLDCFAGSGTTAAVAHKLNRRWIAVESNEDTVTEILQQRLVRVVAGTDDGGITHDSGWMGGGGFTRLDVETSPRK